MTPRLIITDLDNTLYDWVGYFARSFEAMLCELERLLGVGRQALQQDFKRVHQQFGSLEQPFAALELQSVSYRFSGLSRTQLYEKLKPAFDAFSEARREHLALYDGVAETLERVVALRIPVVAHTEASAINAFYRLRFLGIDRHICHLYALEEANRLAHPIEERAAIHRPPDSFVTELPRHQRKPCQEALAEICAREGVSPKDALYIGDSLLNDVSMANKAGVYSVWARYGTVRDPVLWDLLVSVTHWTADDVAREAELRSVVRNIRAQKTIDCFSEILTLL